MMVGHTAKRSKPDRRRRAIAAPYSDFDSKRDILNERDVGMSIRGLAIRRSSYRPSV
jgi:hypothetical protein